MLLLAMGVGVLIGRASTGTAKVPPAQVISVGGTAAGSVAPATTSTTPTTELRPRAPQRKRPKRKRPRPRVQALRSTNRRRRLC